MNVMMIVKFKRCQVSLQLEICGVDGLNTQFFDLTFQCMIFQCLYWGPVFIMSEL